MSPYRTPPSQHEPPIRDPDEVKKWQSLRDQFGQLDDGDIWPPPPERPFEPLGLDVMAVSGDGRRAFLAAGRAAWLMDTESMRTEPLAQLPESASLAMLDDRGERAVAICEPWLYVLDLPAADTALGTVEAGRERATASAEWARVWPMESSWLAEYHSLSRAGQFLVTAADSSSATVRVFDLSARTLIYNFQADCDEGIAIHPDGRTILCYGDSGNMTFYGQSGYQGRIGRTGGGALSRDGKWLLRNDLDDDNALVLHPLAMSGSKLRIGETRVFKPGFQPRTWSAKMRFSPDGRSALVEDSNYGTRLVDLTRGTAQRLRVPMTVGSGILSDGERALLGPTDYDGEGMFECRVGMLFDCAQPGFLGALSATRRGQAFVPVGATWLGFYGGLDSADAPLAEHLDRPYERPGAIRGLLGGSEPHDLDDDDRVLMNEVIARDRAWRRFRPRMTCDLETRQLTAINRGLTYLTPEIVHRAMSRSEQAVRFGEPLLTLSVLRAAGDELRALANAGRISAFAAMLERIRARHRPPAGHNEMVAPRPEQVVSLDRPLAPEPSEVQPLEVPVAEPSAHSEELAGEQIGLDLIDDSFDDSFDDNRPQALVLSESQPLARRPVSYVAPAVSILIAVLSALSVWLLL